MGESLIYSWLRHVKQCQLAQTNWKPSSYWHLDNYDELHSLFEKFGLYYKDKYGFNIFKDCSLDQLLKQAEIDAIGIAFSESAQSIFAVDIAYHEAGLNYGDKDKTSSKIIQKCLRTALCLYGYFNISTGEIIFVSPKINPSFEKELSSIFEELSHIIKQNGLEFTVSLYCNDSFLSYIMQPLLSRETKIADTSELFLRSVQLYQMFSQSPLQTPKFNNQIAVMHPLQKRATTNGYGKAISRIPKWAISPDQNNYKIIRAFFQLLSENGKVNRPALEERCQNEDEHPDVFVRDFKGNFASMKTDKGNSHGKVFTDDGYNIKIWDEINETLESYRNQFTS